MNDTPDTDADAPDYPAHLPADASDLLTEAEHVRLSKCYRMTDKTSKTTSKIERENHVYTSFIHSDKRP
jgi:hypothetical protein